MRKFRQSPVQSSSAWEKVLSAAAAITIVALVGYLVVRNQPFSDPNLVVDVRIMLSFATAVLGATIPGTLNVTWSGKGLAVRATGAIGLFFLTFFFTPKTLALMPVPFPNQTSSSRRPIGISSNGISPSDLAELSPYPVYFGSDYDKEQDAYYPNFKVTPAIRETANKSAQWIASNGNSIKSVVLFSHVDMTSSTEFAMTMGVQGAEVVRQLLSDDGINRDYIQFVSYGKEESLPLFVADNKKKVSKNYNNYVDIAVVFKTVETNNANAEKTKLR